jgi:SAM-dependent methyltransferase
MRFVVGQPFIRATTLHATTTVLCLATRYAVEVLFLLRTVGRSPAAISLLVTVAGLGAVTGALVGARLARAVGRVRPVLLTGLAMRPFNLLIPMTGPGPWLACFAVGAGLSGFCIVAGNVVSVSLRQVLCPDHLLGRMNARTQFLAWASVPLGGLVGGALGHRDRPACHPVARRGRHGALLALADPLTHLPVPRPARTPAAPAPGRPGSRPLSPPVRDRPLRPLRATSAQGRETDGRAPARSGRLPGVAYQLTDGDPEPGSVRSLTFVLFLPGGDCAAVPDGSGGLSLPAGEVRDGEHWLLDASLRVPLETAGYRMQRVHPFAADGDRLYAWLDGDRYTGRRPHASVELVTGAAGEIADRLAGAGGAAHARAVRDAARSFHAQTEASYYADNLRLLEPAYLRGTTPQEGSGFGGDARRWRERRGMIVDGIRRDGSFLDVGCANGLLMESVRAWAAERGYDVEPYGVDLSPGLVALARRRLPQWAGRIEVGNAVEYRPAGARRFTFVHAQLDLVPAARRADMLQHALDCLVEPGGRLLVSHYQADGGTAPTAAEQTRRLGFPVAGQSHGQGAPRAATTAWIDRHG